MAKDPVCGMQVEEKMANATSVYQGQTYYFCARHCKAAFDREPAKYLDHNSGDAREGRENLRPDLSSHIGLRHPWRVFLVGVAALGGALLVVLGISGLRKLTVIGNVPPEMLGRWVGGTAVSLVVGLGMIVWFLHAGIAWARGRVRG